MRNRSDILQYKEGYIRKILRYTSGKEKRVWVKDLTGLKEGRLTVISLVDNCEDRIEGKPIRWSWLCKCECGKESKMFANNIGRGHSYSCGCLGRENATKSVTKHGLGKTPEYYTWFGMMSRCYDPNHIKRKNYLDRGITVCDRWKDFESFYSDIPRKPKGLTWDRIDNDLGYNCGKCEYCIKNEYILNARWATWAVQSRNKSNNRKVKYNGEMVLVFDLAKKFNVSCTTLWNRISKGIDIHTALSMKSLRGKSIKKLKQDAAN